MGETIAFYLLAAALLGFSWKAVNTARVLHAAMYLIASLLAVAGIYLVLGTEMLAAVQLLVYVGGIVVITIFAVLLTSRLGEPTYQPSTALRTVAIAAVLVVISTTLFGAAVYVAASTPGRVPNTAAEIGRAILSPGAEGFLLPFELVSLLLLAALIGAVVIARPAQTGRPDGQHHRFEE